MSNLDERTAVEHPSPDPAKSMALLVDITIIAAITAIAYYLEGLAFDGGWIPFSEEARGASSVVAGAFAAVGLTWRRGGTLRDLGFKHPKSWALLPVQATIVLVVFAAAQFLVPMLISSFIEVPAPDMSRYESLAGNILGAIGMALVLPLTASIPEEIIYRGFFVGRLTEVFQRNLAGAALSVLLPALVFSSIHFSWGIGGMLMTFIMGLIWGTAYLLCDRNLWVVILAHSGGHILFVVQLYLAEPMVA
jgi:membrane protease YdiL (CAAX protease family)